MDKGGNSDVRKSLFKFLTELVSLVSCSAVDVECKIDLLDVFFWYDPDL